MLEKKILLIDDDQAIRDVVQRCLSRAGFNITVSDSPAQAIKLLEEEYYHLILTDIEMNGMDGIELCQFIRKNNRESLIYFFSGSLTSYNMAQLESIGFDGYISKPIDIKTLTQKINEAFSRIERGREVSE